MAITSPLYRYVRLPAGASAVVLAVLAAGLFLPAPASAGGCEHANANPMKSSLDTVERATRCLLNAKRRSHGLRSLDRNGKLDEAALRHSKDMEARNYFSHVSLNGSSLLDRIRRTGYLSLSGGWNIGENIAWGGGDRATPSEMVKMWMNSSGHRANILRSSFRDIGIGVARGTPSRSVADGGTYTTDFGRH